MPWNLRRLYPALSNGVAVSARSRARLPRNCRLCCLTASAFETVSIEAMLTAFGGRSAGQAVGGEGMSLRRLTRDEGSERKGQQLVIAGFPDEFGDVVQARIQFAMRVC